MFAAERPASTTNGVTMGLFRAKTLEIRQSGTSLGLTAEDLRLGIQTGRHGPISPEELVATIILTSHMALSAQGNSCLGMATTAAGDLHMLQRGTTEASFDYWRTATGRTFVVSVFGGESRDAVLGPFGIYGADCIWLANETGIETNASVLSTALRDKLVELNTYGKVSVHPPKRSTLEDERILAALRGDPIVLSQVREYESPLAESPQTSTDLENPSKFQGFDVSDDGTVLFALTDCCGDIAEHWGADDRFHCLSCGKPAEGMHRRTDL